MGFEFASRLFGLRLVASDFEDLTHDWIKGVEKINGLTGGNLNLLRILARKKDMIMTNDVITGTDREPVITTIGNLHGRAVIKVKGESGKKPVRGKGPVKPKSDLRKTAIHKQFRSSDVAAVVGCEKHHRLGDLIGCTKPAERNTGGNHLQALLARF